jgi:hypothetical protein
MLQHRVRREATVRVPCTTSGSGCVVGGRDLTRPGTLTFEAEGRTYEFRSRGVVPDERQTATATLTVRVQGPPEVLAMIAAGDEARTITPNAQTADAVVTRSSGAGSTRELQVRVRVAPAPQGWQFRGTVLRPGADFSFETDQYVVSGMVSAIDAPESTSSR